MKKSNISVLKENMIDTIGKEWMLITAGTPDKFNTMTASWGGIGFLWNKPVAFIFVRPERYTYEFIESNDLLTLAFLGEDHRDILNYCGSKSGRKFDKVKETGLVPVTTDLGAVTFEQARLTLECRKAYRMPFDAKCFLDSKSLERWYNDRPGGTLHVMYIAEIENVYVK